MAALRLAPLLALAGLAACAAPQEEQSARLASELDRTSAVLRAAKAGVEPWNAPPAPAAAQGVAAQALAQADSGTGPERLVAVSAAAYRDGPVRDARGLVGATAPTLLRVLGSPDMRRRDGDAEAWLYRGQTCMLDVVLYPDAGAREGRVAFAAARATGIDRVAEGACLQEIQRANQLVARAR